MPKYVLQTYCLWTTNIFGNQGTYCLCWNVISYLSIFKTIFFNGYLVRSLGHTYFSKIYRIQFFKTSADIRHMHVTVFCTSCHIALVTLSLTHSRMYRFVRSTSSGQCGIWSWVDEDWDWGWGWGLSSFNGNTKQMIECILNILSLGKGCPYNRNACPSPLIPSKQSMVFLHRIEWYMQFFPSYLCFECDILAISHKKGVK